MIDSAALISRGGLVLWTFSFEEGANVFLSDEKNSHINELVQTVILEVGRADAQERGGDRHAQIRGVHFRWVVMNALDATLFVAYKVRAAHAQGIQNTQNLVELLDKFPKAIMEAVTAELGNRKSFNWFDTPFEVDVDDAFRGLVLQTDLSSIRSSSAHESTRAPSPRPQKEPRDAKDRRQSTKAKRQWDVKTTVTQKDMDELDFSDKSEPRQRVNHVTPPARQPEAQPPKPSRLSAILSAVRSRLAPRPAEKQSQGFLDQFSNLVLTYAGNLTITEEAVKAPLEELKTKLRSKNVAGDICDMIGSSVAARLVGAKTGSLRSLSATVREAMEEAVRRILTPRETLNLLHKIREVNAAGGVYSLVFLGVNGVGKSTSLAKVAYMLKSNGLKVLLVACDTFRSGAVEQIRIHADNLELEVFERGYGKDPAQIAREGLKHAAANGFDVVLIDTAGRMQDNEPLMAALAKLINVNNPNLILFVGEALVGNDAVDQLKKFNHAIARMGEHAHNRNIDALLLTKFDTVDDKVGAALSMVYITGKPILFVGNGQSYADLATLDVDRIVRFLIT